MQQLELQYFDRVLDQQLNVVYEREIKKLATPFISYPLSGYLKVIQWEILEN